MKVMKAKYQGLGPIKCHELSVLICFIIVIVLWFMRKPLFMAGKFLIDFDLFLIFKDKQDKMFKAFCSKTSEENFVGNLEEYNSVRRNQMVLEFFRNFNWSIFSTPGVGILSVT